jgi:hypothetical protein
MMDNTEVLRWVTHMLCRTWAMYFSAAASSENDHGRMNLASNTASVPSTIPSRVATIQLEIGDAPIGVALIPGPIELLRGGLKLDDKVARQVLRLCLTTLLAL